MNKKGFTLVELLAVIVVLAIIALIGYSVVGDVISGVQESADKQTVMEYARAVRTTSIDYYATNMEYPSNEQLRDLVKLANANVVCEIINYSDNADVELKGCTVNDSTNTYCYANDEASVCSVDRLVTIQGHSQLSKVPSPDSPAEIQSLGAKSKNLFNYNLLFKPNETEIKKAGITYTKTDEGILVNGTATDWASTVEINVKDILKTGKTYIASGSVGDARVIFKSVINGEHNWSSTKTITGEEETISIYFQVALGKIVNNVLIKPQLEEGSTATPYEHYGYKITLSSGSDSADIYLNEPLRSITYGNEGEANHLNVYDELDLRKGKVTRRIGEVEFKGNENWVDKYLTSSGFIYMSFINSNKIQNKKIGLTNVFSNYFPLDLSGDDDSDTIKGSDVEGSYTAVKLYLNRTQIPNKTAWAGWLSNQYNAGNPLTVIYEYETPNTEEIIDVSSVNALEGGDSWTVTDGNITLDSSKITIGY